MQRTEPELERSAAEQLAKETCVVPLMDREVLPSLVVNNIRPHRWGLMSGSLKKC